MMGNVTKVTLNFFLEKLDDIPRIIIFLTHDRIVLIVAISHLSFHRRKPRYLSPSSTPSIPWLLYQKFARFDLFYE